MDGRTVMMPTGQATVVQYYGKIPSAPSQDIWRALYIVFQFRDWFLFEVLDRAG